MNVTFHLFGSTPQRYFLSLTYIKGKDGDSYLYDNIINFALVQNKEQFKFDK